MLSVERDGFAIVPDVIPVATISQLTESLADSSARRTRAGMRNVLGIPKVHELAMRQTLLDLAEEVLGQAATPFRGTLFDKSVHSNWLVVWHQDTALPIREKRDAPGWGPWSVKNGVTCAHAPASALEKVLAIRVHLDESNADNGPLRVLPATHKFGVLSDDQIHDLANSRGFFESHVGMGGALLMRPLIIHASSKARSNAPRRVLHIEYATSLCLSDHLELAVDNPVVA
ncbi:MAG TPA: phytanoyl-CoA dioxygenase family protein [Terriglobales bacterium]|nr:phytanoyl-CoA dioxygenase family protein [Terriglobales bacterium]